MTILTKDEIDTCALDGCRDDYAFAEEVEKAVLEKLAGMELPEPEVMGWDRLDCAIEGYTAEQLHQAFAQGAASQLSAEPALIIREGDSDIIPAGTNLFTLKAPK
jgi:hypothetical protein